MYVLQNFNTQGLNHKDLHVIDPRKDTWMEFPRSTVEGPPQHLIISNQLPHKLGRRNRKKRKKDIEYQRTLQTILNVPRTYIQDISGKNHLWNYWHRKVAETLQVEINMKKISIYNNIIVPYKLCFFPLCFKNPFCYIKIFFNTLL